MVLTYKLLYLYDDNLEENAFKKMPINDFLKSLNDYKHVVKIPP